MPSSSSVAWPRLASRVVISLLGVIFLAASLGTAGPASGRGLSDRISANRSGQLYAESAMRAQDAILASIKRDQKQVRKDLKQARRDLKRASRALASAIHVLQERRSRLARVEALYEDPSMAPLPERYDERVRGIQREIRVAERRKSNIGTRVRALGRVVKAREARSRALKRQRRATIARRESAEAALAGRIVEMESLAAARADNQAAVSLAGTAAFSWPSTGRISQTYGCTGFRLNPARGSCRHFHDGVDVVDGYGTPVRAVAVGVVAYAGWNPWDEGGRAWIVVVVHPDGWVSRYGHMVPSDRVRAGELVHTGQIIGRMGSTGRSTGTHLHLEMLREGRDVDPLAYLPAGVVKVRVDKTSTRKGKQALRARQKARQLSRQKARAEKARRAPGLVEPAAGAAAISVACLGPVPLEELDPLAMVAARAAAPASASGEPGACAPPASAELASADLAAELASAEPSATSRPASPSRGASSSRPGVPLPPRGTSPVPA